MIWGQSLAPQLISLQYATLSETTTPSAKIVGCRYSAADNVSRGFKSASLNKQLEVINTPTPAAFSISRASRAVALSKGYKTWRISRLDGKVRDLIWNPRMDTIFFENKIKLRTLYGIYDNDFSIFVKQFPAETREIRSLALPYDTFWLPSFGTKYSSTRMVRRGSLHLLQLLEKPSSITELFVMVNEENNLAKELEEKDGHPDQLEFWNGSRECFGKGFHAELRRYRKACGEVLSPKMRIVWNFEMILNGEGVELPECCGDD